ncbi:MAG: adenosylcobinamide-GDP ribazoletransferase [Candidatus Omnitrophota bacterium]|jgi:adenosylcobinamide-GDP ribazoletransferase
MVTLLLALQFLTVLPLKINKFSDHKIAYSTVFFPVAGFLIGLLLVGLDIFLLKLNLPYLAVNVILVVSLGFITGGMHLDGLADTADAFLSGKNKDEMLSIMRDPHIGVMGVLSIISVMFLKIALLFSITGVLRFDILILMCVLSRWSVVLQMFFFPYARKEGKAGKFIQGMNLKIFILSTVITVLIAFFILNARGLILLFIIGLSAYIAAKIASHKIGGITGDTLGATIELMEITALLTVCLAPGVIYG